MPLVAYTYLNEGIQSTEKEYFIKCKTRDELTEQILETVIRPWNLYREIHHWTPVTLVGYEVINRLIHAHTWVKGHADRYACKQRYRCSSCGITGYSYLHLFNGPQNHIDRDEPFKAEKFNLCREKLKPMPKSTQLIFR